MSEKSDANQSKSASKVRRKPRADSVLTPTFAAAYHTSSRDQSHLPQPANDLLQRQCSCGKHTIAGGVCTECQQNQGVVSQVSAEETGEASPGTIRNFPSGSSGSDFSAVPARTVKTSTGQFIQPNMTVNKPGDQYEREADQVAAAVMQMPESSQPVKSDSKKNISRRNPAVSRLPSISRLQASGAATSEAAPYTEARISRMRDKGQPLTRNERDFFETRMGYDFSGVRVHTDANAVQASRELNARAFTFGNNIAFNDGEYQPGGEGGRRLLAHELTHVIQQNDGKVQRAEGDEEDANAAEADPEQRKEGPVEIEIEEVQRTPLPSSDSEFITGPYDGVQRKDNGVPDIQKVDPATVSAAVAVIAITYNVVKDIASLGDPDVTYEFERMRNQKYPNNNKNWEQITPWRPAVRTITLSKSTGFGRTGMKVKVHWEYNGFGLSGIWLSKEETFDTVGWGADFKWLIQPLMVTRQNSEGYPVAKVTLAVDGEFTYWPVDVYDYNPTFTLDGEGNLTED